MRIPTCEFFPLLLGVDVGVDGWDNLPPVSLDFLLGGLSFSLSSAVGVPLRLVGVAESFADSDF